MKKILLLTLLTTFTFSQAEEWIYYQMNASNGNGDLSIYRIKPDGTENELVIEDVRLSDIYSDGSKMLFQDNDYSISMLDLESMDIIHTIIEQEEGGRYNANFTNDENIIIYCKYTVGDPANDQLFKYSCDGDLQTLMASGLNRFIVNGIMSPDKSKLI